MTADKRCIWFDRVFIPAVYTQGIRYTNDFFNLSTSLPYEFLSENVDPTPCSFRLER